MVVYLSRKGNLSIKQKLENECRKGTRIVAVGFTMAGWSPIKTFKVVKGIPSYVYEIKGEKEEEGESNKTRLEEQPEEEETNNKNNDTEGEGEGEEGNMHAHDARDEHVHVDVPGWDWSYFLLVISLSSIADQSEMWTLGTFSNRADVARMRQTRLSSPDQGGDIREFRFVTSLCVALRSHVRPLTIPLDHTPRTTHDT